MIATIATGVGLSVGAFQLGQRIELTRIQATFERTAGERIAAVEARLLATIGSLRALSSFFEATGEVSPDQFRKFVSPLLNAYAGVQAFEWVPLVSADHIRELTRSFAISNGVDIDAAFAKPLDLSALRQALVKARELQLVAVQFGA